VTDIEDTNDCASEGTGVERVVRTFEEWAVQDVKETIRQSKPIDYFLTTVRMRQPASWPVSRKWEQACENYFIDSYTYYRRHGDKNEERCLPSKNDCTMLAYRDTYEWMYCQLNISRWRPRRTQQHDAFMKNRGW